VGAAAGAAGNCAEGLAATGFIAAFPNQARAIADASNAITGYGVIKNVIQFATTWI
jgi:hypothetical protein